MVANAIRSFNMEASEASRVGDTFISVSNRTNTTVTELAEAMKYAGTVAGASGKTIEETAAVIGLFSDRGIKASMAGTQFRGVMSKLAKPTAQATQAMRDMGLQAHELDPALHSMEEIAEALQRAFGSLKNPLDKASMASRIFGIRNMTGALAMSMSVDKLKDLKTFKK